MLVNLLINYNVLKELIYIKINTENKTETQKCQIIVSTRYSLKMWGTNVGPLDNQCISFSMGEIERNSKMVYKKLNCKFHWSHFLLELVVSEPIDLCDNFGMLEKVCTFFTTGIVKLLKLVNTIPFFCKCVHKSLFFHLVPFFFREVSVFCWVGGGVCLSACWDTQTPPGLGLDPPGLGLDPPEPRPGQPPQADTPLGLGLDTPLL